MKADKRERALRLVVSALLSSSHREDDVRDLAVVISDDPNFGPMLRGALDAVFEQLRAPYLPTRSTGSRSQRDFATDLDRKQGSSDVEAILRVISSLRMSKHEVIDRAHSQLPGWKPPSNASMRQIIGTLVNATPAGGLSELLATITKGREVVDPYVRGLNSRRSGPDGER